MKYLSIIVLIFFIFADFSFAQTPGVIKTFKQRFPDAIRIKWSKDQNNCWQVDFLLAERKTSAVFEPDGHWLKSKQEIRWSDIGVEEVKQVIKRDFPDYKDQIVIIFNDAFVGTYYNVNGIFYDWIGNPWPPRI